MLVEKVIITTVSRLTQHFLEQAHNMIVIYIYFVFSLYVSPSLYLSLSVPYEMNRIIAEVCKM